jgi:hypothetical protein
MVNEYIWKFFVALYGGGPAIKRVGKDIYNGVVDQEYPEVSAKNDYKLKIQFTEDDKYNIEELKGMIAFPVSGNEKEGEVKNSIF